MDDAALGQRLQTLAVLRPRWGNRRLYRLPRREGVRVNRKRVQRVYRETGLHARQRPRKRVAPRASRNRPLLVPTSAGSWTSSSMRWPMFASFGI